MINVFDGTRQEMSSKVQLLVRVMDGNQKLQYSRFRKGPHVPIRKLPVFDNLGDNYTVLVSARGRIDAGFTPLKLTSNAWQHIALMLLPKDGAFNFAMARWDALKSSHPQLIRLLRHGTATEKAANDRYDNLLENRGEVLAALLNIVTAISSIHLPIGTPLQYLKSLLWRELSQDRFYAYAEEQIIDQVVEAADQGIFRPEFGSGLFHPGATRSFKEVRFGEANVQITFHENDRRKVGGLSCVKVEIDMDYFRDPGAHALLEVIPNTITGRLTDPRQVYVLRWIAGRKAGVPEFDPPYVVV